MEGVTLASVLTSVAGAAAGAVLSSALAPKTPKAPSTPTPPPASTPEEADKVSRDAQRKQRQVAAAAVGRSDTLLTGAGLGEVNPANTAVKTLLGS